MPSETPHHQFLNALNVLLKNPSELHHYLPFPREDLLNTQSLTGSGTVPVSEKPATWQLALQADGTAARVGVIGHDLMCCAFVFGSCSNATLRLHLHNLAARGSGSSPPLKASVKQTSRGSGAEL